MSQNQPPPPPPNTPPPAPVFSPPKTSYHSARQRELDDIRRRGLAKIFNKHFTTAASKIQHERAEAELALAEIERRKAELSANPRSFSGGMTLTQLDQLHMKLQKRKHDVHRKQRETQELYRRYVSQYGSDDGKAANISQKGMPMVPEHGSDDIFWQSDLLASKAMDMNEATKDSDVAKLLSSYSDDMKNKECGEINTPRMTISSDLPYNNSNNPKNDKAEKYPDYNVGGVKSAAKALESPNPTPISMPSMDSTYSDVIPQDRKSTSLPIDPQSAIPAFKSNNADNKRVPIQTASVDSQGGDSSPDSLLGNVMVTTKGPDKVDDDSESTMSGLTTIDGPTVAEAEWTLTEFLRVETENIRKMLAMEENQSYDSESHTGIISDNSNNSVIVGQATQATKRAEEMLRQFEKQTAWMNDPTLLESESDGEEEEENNEEALKDKSSWRGYWSEEHEREYYYNIETNQTCWTKPQGVKIDFKYNNKANDDDDNEEDLVGDCPSSPEKKSVRVKDYTKSRRLLVESQTLEPSEYTNEEMIDVFRPDNDAMSVNSMASSIQSSKVLEYRRKRARKRKRKRRRRIAFVLLTIMSTGLFVYRRSIRAKDHKLITTDEEKHEHKNFNDDIKQESDPRNINLQENEEEHMKRQDNTKIESVEHNQAQHIHKDESRIENQQDQKEYLHENEVNIEVQEEQLEKIGRNDETDIGDKLEEELVQEEQQEDINYEDETHTEIEVDQKERVNEGDIQEDEQEVLVHKDETIIKVQQSYQNQLTKEDSNLESDGEDKIAVSQSDKLNETDKSILDPNTQTATSQGQDQTVSIHIQDRPWACKIPLAHFKSKKCAKELRENPLYDCQALVDSMMQ